MPLLRALAVAVLAASGCGRPASSALPAASCPAATLSVAGACLSRDEAALYCGKAARPEAGGCAPNVCGDEEPADLATGACVPLLTLRQLLAGPEAKPKADAAIGCNDEGARLVVERHNVACLPRAAACGPGARWVSGSCRPDPVCPRGTVFDGSQCVAVTHREGAQDVLDVGAWIRLVLGSDGGKGTPAVCAPLALRPWRSGVGAHGEAVDDVEFDLLFPDNDVKAARVDVRARRGREPADPEPGPAVGAAHYLEPLWSALRSLGGVSNAASASLVVHCAIDGGGGVLGAESLPKAEPAAPAEDKDKDKP